MKALLHNRSTLPGALLTLIFAGAAIVSLVWVPYDTTVLNIADRMKLPSLVHPFGTDQFGRDILSMLMVGARTSIAVALVAVGIGMLVGVPLGLAAAARKGSLPDEIIMRTNDLVFAFPSLLIAVMITAVFGASALNAIIAIGIFNIPVFARLTRGAALTLWSREYVMAARVAGKGAHPDLLGTHSPERDQSADCPGHDSVFARYPCRSGPELCRSRGSASNGQLGTHARRQPDHDLPGAAPGNFPGHGDPAHRARLEPSR